MENGLYVVTAIEHCGEQRAVRLDVEEDKRRATEILAQRFTCKINQEGQLVSKELNLATTIYLHELRANVRVIAVSPVAATC